MCDQIEKWSAEEKVHYIMSDQARSQIKANSIVEQYFRERSDAGDRDIPRLPCLMHTTG